MILKTYDYEIKFRCFEDKYNEIVEAIQKITGNNCIEIRVIQQYESFDIGES